MGHGTKNPPEGMAPLGRNCIHLTRGERGSLKAILRSPNRVSLLHKGGNSLYGAAGAEILSRISKYPSSATQLPILAALHAGLPTLFAINIHDILENVKTQMEFFSKSSSPGISLPGEGNYSSFISASVYSLQVAPVWSPVTVTEQPSRAFSSFSAAWGRQMWRRSMASAFRMLWGLA